MNKIQILKRKSMVTDYGAYREYFVKGRKILGWIEQDPKANLPESEKFFYAIGNPKQTNYVSYQCDTLDQAREELRKIVEDF